MSFEVDRYSSAWGHIALCADLTWASEPADEFIIANQRLWAQHCRVSQVLQDATNEAQNLQSNNLCELTEKRSSTSQIQENGSNSGRKSVKDVIPESRLAQYYGNFFYDEAREKCYTSTNEKCNSRSYSGQGCDNSDLTECWMLPEVEYWFRKLVDEPAEKSLIPRRRRQYRITADDDLYVGSEINGHRSAASERLGLATAEEAEAALAAKVMAVRSLWAPRAASPPPAQRKIRARKRQPRRLSMSTLAPPPPAYCLEAPAQLFCDPKCKFQFEPPRPPQLTDHQRALGRLSASVQAVMRASASRCQPYRGTTISRYAPTSQRPARHGVWWPRDQHSPRLERSHLIHVPQTLNKAKEVPKEKAKTKKTDAEEQKDSEKPSSSSPEQKEESSNPFETPKVEEDVKTQPKEKVIVDAQQPSTSSAGAMLDAAALRNKRLYSTVLSTAPINLASAVRLSQKLTPALLKLNPKLVLQARGRPPNVDHKYEELEKEALEQYKASDESIDTKFHELEKQAVEQYSNSNSNTSCSSGEKRTSSSPPNPENDSKKKQPAKFPNDKSSGVICTQNFPDLNSSAKGQTSSVTNLKNSHAPPRGEKKEQAHRSIKNSRSVKSETHRAASDTDETKGSHKSMRWTLHIAPPKKRHLTLCVSDCSSDEEEEASGSIKDAGPCSKSHGGKMKMSAHGGGDLNPIKRKT